jgi:pyridoxine/pyridoxamine 5'-phosphate oxidase
MKLLNQLSKVTTKDIRVLNFLNNHKSGVLATVSNNKMPHASVIYYHIDSTFTITFLSKARTQKSQDIKRNPNATLVIYDEASQTTVQVQGAVFELTDSKAVSDVFRNTLRASLITSKLGVPPIAKLNAGQYIAYKLAPSEIRMAVYARPDSGNYERLFETIELAPI